MMLFGVVLIWIIFAIIFFFILYHVIYAAINAANNDSKLWNEVREIRELLAARNASAAESPAQTREDPALTEECPGCGNRVHPGEATCPHCGLRLG